MGVIGWDGRNVIKVLLCDESEGMGMMGWEWCERSDVRRVMCFESWDGIDGMGVFE